MSEVTLALGGGGVKGIAHIGVIRRLEEEGYQIKAVAGTSAGGIVGALLAAGYDSHRLESVLNEFTTANFFSRANNEGPSLMGLNGLSNALIKTLGSKTFEELVLPFACTAVDLNTAQEMILNQGRVVDSVMATVAFPGVFPPKELQGHELVDGGVLDPVPVALARWLAPQYPVIAVCLSPKPENWGKIPPFQVPPNTPIPKPLLTQISKLRLAQAFNVFSRSIDISSRMLAEMRLQLDKPDAIIRPEVYMYGIIDNVNPQHLIELGYKAADEAMPSIAETLSIRNKITRRFVKHTLLGKEIDDQSES